MAILVGKPEILFGGKPVRIRGFVVTARMGEWVIARQGKKEFFVERKRNGWRLFPKTLEGYCRTDKAIWVPRE